MNKVIYFGFDYFSFVLRDLLKRDDTKVLAIFTKESSYSCAIRELATENYIPIYLCPLNPNIHQDLIKDANIIISASYDNLIPNISRIKYQVNLHPTVLPIARGPSPIPWILIDYPEAAGVTLHVMTENFDAGPIILSHKINYSSATNFLEYSLKCNKKASELVSKFLDDPEYYFSRATPQDEQQALFVKQFPEERRTVSARNSGEEILALIQKLGPIGIKYAIGNVSYNLFGGTFIKASPTEYPEFEKNAFYLTLRCINGVIICKPQDFIRID